MYAAIARFSIRRRRWVLTAWTLVFALGIALAGTLFGQLKESGGNSASESAQGRAILQEASTSGPRAVVLVKGPAVDAPATVTAVQQLTAKLAAMPFVTGTVNAYTSSDPHLRSNDGHESVVLVSLEKDTDHPMAAHHDVEAIREAAHGAVPGADVQVGGDAAAGLDGMVASTNDLMWAELLSMPVLLVALVFIFKGWRAAVLPVVASMATGAGAMLVLLGITHLTDVAPQALDVVQLLGLGLAVDYGLLMVNRFREARAAGSDVAAATEHTVRTAGRTVTFSALTVAAALSGLLLLDDPTFTSLALGGISTTLIAMTAALTLIPAFLASWGAKLKAAARQNAEDGQFGRLARRVQRHPVLVALGATAILAMTALPFLHVNTSLGDPRTLPATSESRQVSDSMAASFQQMGTEPVVVVAKVQPTDPRVLAYAEQLGHVKGVMSVAIEPGARGETTLIDVVPSGTTQGEPAQQLVRALRADRPSFTTYVTGEAASLVDFSDQIANRMPYAIAIIAVSTFLLLFLMTGSVLVPLKALVMNTLSLGATFGALVWVFQDGHLAQLLGFTSFGAIEAWAPPTIAVFAFGLSMDYEVFLLSRIKESHDELRDTNEAVAHGLQRSGRIITSAALLVMIVFLGFAAGQTLGIKEFGLALAIAVLVDATLVRCLLVPATMTLLGRANWWAPAPLRWVHRRVGLSETPAEVAIGAAM
ncbi:MMPL family transporter [Sinomonas sp. P47F7]|uniref:MMPL family transporter n=1 Tax=Sinomonas sp. P47F7 TaxID=3410987 RepID=UPI003BF58153